MFKNLDDYQLKTLRMALDHLIRVPGVQEDTKRVETIMDLTMSISDTLSARAREVR